MLTECVTAGNKFQQIAQSTISHLTLCTWATAVSLKWQKSC